MSRTTDSRDRSSNQTQTMLMRVLRFRPHNISGFLRNSSAGYNVYIPTILHRDIKTTRNVTVHKVAHSSLNSVFNWIIMSL